jgi:hypothetical protein
MPLARSLRSHDSRIFRPLLLPGPLFKGPRNILVTCKTLLGMRSRYELNIPTNVGGGMLEVTFIWRRRLAPNSSPSKLRLNPDELNCDSWRALYQKCPPGVGVETKLSLLSPCFAKRLARDIATQPVAVVVRQYLRASLPALGRCPF